MGAALTYARRSALFTLVGIADEDDLDAPDLTACGPAAGYEPDPRQNRFPYRESGNGRLRGSTKRAPTAVLEAPQSAALRDKLLAEVASLRSAECAVMWAAQTLPAKNSLIAADATLLEEAFEHKLSGLSSPVANGVSASDSAAPAEQAHLPHAGIDKGVLAFPHRAGTATASIYVTLPAAMSRLRAQAVRPASSSARAGTNSLFRSAASITALSIGPATSGHGGRRPAWSRSRSRAYTGERGPHLARLLKQYLSSLPRSSKCGGP
jgi:hypothetical protein